MVKLVRQQLRHRPSPTYLPNQQAPTMANHHQETDYFVPILAPYAQWVSAYRELIPALYEQHKTVKRTWKAFREAVPGVEQRLEFGVFEQILLFSLFLSEWQEAYEVRPIVPKASRPAPDIADDPPGPGPEAVIQELRDVSAERDRALWNLKDLEEKVGDLKAQNERLENLAKILEVDLDRRQAELNGANENLRRVTRELDIKKNETAGLRLQMASLEDRVQKLLQRTDCSGFSTAQGSQSAVSCIDMVKQDASQMVIQWPGQASVNTAGPWSLHNPVISPKKIGRWNAQLSKDGYYRLYRKIRGRVHSIYIGKDLDIDRALAKIAEKEKELLGVNPFVEA